MLNEASSPTVANCIFSKNYAYHGGGMVNRNGSNPTLTDCTFIENEAYHGGGMSIEPEDDASSPDLTRCTFDRNTAPGGYGGGLSIRGGNSTLTDCTFTGNSADATGGGLFMWEGTGTVRLTGCVFGGNSANGGGGMANSGGNPVLIACTFTGNTAAGGAGMSVSGISTVINCSFNGNSNWAHYGGAIRNNGTMTVINSSFNGNSVVFYGGAIYNWEGAVLEVVNCTFSGNSSSDISGWGGAIATGTGTPLGTLTVTNCVFSENSAVGQGGGIWSYANTTVMNSILWGNVDPSGTVETAQLWVNDSPTVNYSLIQGLDGFSSGIGNIDGDPLFLDPDGADGLPGTPDDDLRLGAGSPGIDAGDNSALPADEYDLDDDGDTAEPLPLDLSGQRPRSLDGDADGTATVDMGAYEYDGPPFLGTFYVRATAPTGGDGLSWETAFDELRTALPRANVLAQAGHDVQVWVAAGTYRPAPAGGSNDATFELTSTVRLYGGFAGTETALEERILPITPERETTLSGDLDGDDEVDFPEFTNYSDNSLHVLTGSQTQPTAVLDGFTIASGYGPGAGMYNNGSTAVVIRNCTFEHNYAGWMEGSNGAAMLNQEGASPTVTNCAFRKNRAGDNGAAIYNHEDSDPLLINCLFERNVGHDDGAIFNGWWCNPILVNCTFRGNKANNCAGAITYGTYTTEPCALIGCAFIGNQAGPADAAVSFWQQGTPLTLYDCTFTANLPNAINVGSASVTAKNCIIWGNESAGDLANAGITFSDVQGGIAGTGNIDADPLFMFAIPIRGSMRPGAPRTTTTATCTSSCRPAASIQPATAACRRTRTTSTRTATQQSRCRWTLRLPRACWTAMAMARRRSTWEPTNTMGHPSLASCMCVHQHHPAVTDLRGPRP